VIDDEESEDGGLGSVEMNEGSWEPNLQ